MQMFHTDRKRPSGWSTGPHTRRTLRTQRPSRCLRMRRALVLNCGWIGRTAFLMALRSSRSCHRISRSASTSALMRVNGRSGSLAPWSGVAFTSSAPDEFSREADRLNVASLWVVVSWPRDSLLQPLFSGVSGVSPPSRKWPRPLHDATTCCAISVKLFRLIAFPAAASLFVPSLFSVVSIRVSRTASIFSSASTLASSRDSRPASGRS